MAKRSLEMKITKEVDDDDDDDDKGLSEEEEDDDEEEETRYQEEAENDDDDDYGDNDGAEEEDDEDYGEDDGEEEEEEEEVEAKDRKKKVMIRIYRGEGRVNPSTVSYNPLCCQVDGCCVDLTVAKRYHRRHRVCEQHAKAAVVSVSEIAQRFCQQCSRFHEISEFDGSKRSCRERLAGHNKRRRRSHPDDLQAENEQKPSIYKMNSS